jgi:putative lipoic acid-binding regulatory protein
MTASTSRAPARELIEANHEFPGEYLIKAFGPADELFRAAVAEAARAAVGARLVLRERISSKGNSICITVVLQAEDAGEVIRAYERLHDVPRLKLIL